MRRLRNALIASSLSLLTAASLLSACSGKKNTELVVAVQTDLRVPKDLNAVTVRVISVGAVQFEHTYEVGPSGLHLPATIGVVPQDPGNLQPIDVELIGRFSSDPDPATRVERVIRKARLTFAKDRVGLVRLPLRFSCYDKTGCSSDQTCVAGACVPVPTIEGATLPDYSAEQVFGAGGSDNQTGACWDADVCLAGSTPIGATTDPCVFDLASAPVPTGGDDAGIGPMDATAMPDAPAMADAGADPGADASPSFDGGKMPFKALDGSKPITVVLAQSGGTLGFCSGGVCRIPLDFDPDEGWSWTDDSHTKVRLAQGLCAKLGAGLRVEATDACATKVASMPFCDAASASDGGVEDTSPPDTSMCKPRGCEGTTCGATDDGCGHMLDCTCSAPLVCMGGACLAPPPDAGADGATDAGHMLVSLKIVGPFTTTVGGFVTLTAAGQYSDGSMADVTALVTWSSSNPAVATITTGADGTIVNGISSGFTLIRAQDPMSGVAGGADFSVTGGPADAGGCVPKTCAAMGANCGTLGDGCGGVVDCGTCAPPSTCGGGGVPNMCGGASCMPKTCAMMGANCGMQNDGCGSVINCGSCVSPATCGGGGMPNVCGVPPGSDAGAPGGDGGTSTDAGACVPETCAAFGYNCGLVGDGCGGTLNCGTCDTGTCGGGGMPNRCG